MNEELLRVLENSESRAPQPIAGAVLSILGGVIIAAGIALPSYLPKHYVLSLVKPFMGIATLAGMGIWRAGQRRLQPILADVLKNDPRGIVVFFRPFEGESRSSLHPILLMLTTLVHGSPNEKYHIPSVEEHLDEVAKMVGPFVAIGKPNDSTVTLGATRVFSRGDGWQDLVTLLLNASNAAVFKIEDFSFTDSTFWEFQATKHMLPQSSIFVIVTPSWIRRLSKFEKNEQSRRFANEIGVPLNELSLIRRPGVLCWPDGAKMHFIKSIRNPFLLYQANPIADALHRAFIAVGLLDSAPGFRERPIAGAMILSVLAIGVLLILFFFLR